MSDDGGTETEWAVRWHDNDGIVWYGPGERGREQAEAVAHIYDYGTLESQVDVVYRTVTYGPWTEPDSPLPGT